MPYQTIGDLPASVRHALPTHAQEIYLAAFGKAWPRFENEEDREATCHRIAWTAVKRSYVKNDGRWIKRE